MHNPSYSIATIIVQLSCVLQRLFTVKSKGLPSRAFRSSTTIRLRFSGSSALLLKSLSSAMTSIAGRDTASKRESKHNFSFKDKNFNSTFTPSFAMHCISPNF